MDLTIGIDVGMSGTGVAFRRHRIGDSQCDVVPLKWGVENNLLKLPTRLAYARTEQSQSPLHWGLNIPDDTSNLSIKEWFKTDFDGNDPNHTSTDKLYVDYLKCLHEELSVRFVRDGILGKAWEHANIAFVFSTPACWGPTAVARFKDLVSKAGFQKEQGKHSGRGVHSIAITLTEPQATAAFELHTTKPSANLRRGDNVLIVDVGAGTGDFSLVQVAANAENASHFWEHEPAIGRNIGSSYIDNGFEMTMARILEPHQHLLGHTAPHVAWEMRHSTAFLEAKHDFGTDESTAIPIPHLEDPNSINDDFIRNGELANPGAELERLFDAQIKKITDSITVRASQLNYILLSGGVGSSVYVQRQLERFYNGRSMFESTRLVVSRRPRLAVCMGLVYAATSNEAVFPTIACRAAFGVVKRIPSADSSAAPSAASLGGTLIQILTRGKGIDGRFDDCVDWIIRKGQQIQNGSEVEFKSKVFFEPGERRVCNIEIVYSLSDHPKPSKDFIKTHQVMRADLSAAKVKGKRKVKWTGFNSGVIKLFLEVNFTIKAKIGPAEAHFLCVDAEGRKVSELVKVPVPREPPIMAVDDRDEE